MLAVPAYATLNAHPGILPDYRGMDPTFWAILEERFDHVGSTLHLVNQGIDTGAILERRFYRWQGSETMANLDQCLNEDCFDLLVESCQARWPSLLAGAAVQPPSKKYYHVMPPALLRQTRIKLKRYLRERSYRDSRALTKGLY